LPSYAQGPGFHKTKQNRKKEKERKEEIKKEKERKEENI
jgi:hypothetical protein